MSGRRILMPLALTAMAMFSVQAVAQGAFPPQQPQSSGAASPFPPVNQSSSGNTRGGDAAERQDCVEKLAPLRADAMKHAAAVKAASERKAGAREACALVRTYVAAEAKLLNYVTTRQMACGFPAEIPKQLEANHKRSNGMMQSICKAVKWEVPAGQGPADQPPLLRQDPPQLPDQPPFRASHRA